MVEEWIPPKITKNEKARHLGHQMIGLWSLLH